MFKIYHIGGLCPVQATGRFLGKFFYFRSRGSIAYIEFHDSEVDFNNNVEPLITFELKRYTWPYAGYITNCEVFFLLAKGFYKYVTRGKKKGYISLNTQHDEI